MPPQLGVRRAQRANSDAGRALARGDYAAAERGFTAALSWASGISSAEATAVAAEANLGAGRVSLARDDFAAAGDHFRQVQELCPAAAAGFYWAGCAAAHATDYPRAETEFGAALGRDAQLSKAYLQRGYVRLRLGKEDLALADLDAAARLQPLPSHARLLVASLLLRRSRWAEAESTVAGAGQETPLAAAILGIALQHQGKTEEAFTAYKRAVAGGIRDENVVIQHGVIAYQLAQRGNQPDAATEGCGESHMVLARALRDAAYSAAEQGDWPRAAALLRRCGDTGTLLDTLVLGLGGHRRDALDRLTTAARQEPANLQVLHTLAAMSLHTLGSGGAQPERWETCISAWASLLHDEEFQQRWRDGAQRRYGRPVPREAFGSMRNDLRELIEQQLSSAPASMLDLLAREMTAARTMSSLGGFPAGGGTTVVCGPLRIAELGMHNQFGHFTRELPDSSGHRQRLLRQFSLLGIAAGQLAAGRPAEAANLAMDLRCPSCRAATGQDPEDGPLVCTPGCADFDRYNPAFAGLASKHKRLSAAGAALAIESLMDCATAEITTSGVNVSGAVACWHKASGLADRFGRRRQLMRSVADTALGRADVCERKMNWTEAVMVLDAALSVVDASNAGTRQRISTRLAVALTSRGIHHFNADIANAGQAQEDLSRAIELAPHLVRTRLNLALMVRGVAYQRLREGDVKEALHLLNEAMRHCARGLADHPADHQLRAELDRTRSERDDLARGR